MLNTYKTQFENIIELLKQEITKLRTSRAAPSLVEDIAVEVYGGSRMQLKELASISVPEPRSLVIKPWDKNLIKDIEKGLINSNLEFNPIVETDILRIQLPELTQETREKLVKKLHGMLEQNRIKLRQIRDGAKKAIEQKHKNGEMAEDDKFSLIEDLNKMTREFSEQIDNLGKKKEEEIMTI
ncbi:MAG: ribosome recycling factor [Candidatus Jacksonbacteria bacterium]